MGLKDLDERPDTPFDAPEILMEWAAGPWPTQLDALRARLGALSPELLDSLKERHQVEPDSIDRLGEISSGLRKLLERAQPTEDELGTLMYGSPMLTEIAGGLRAAPDYESLSEGTATELVSIADELDHRSLNTDTFNPIYVLMGHALPEEAQSDPVQ